MTFAHPTKPILMLVALTLSAMLLEGAGIDWSVIFMRDVFATPPFISGLALALVAFSQFIVRFFADDFVERYGPEKVTYWSVITLGIGVSLVGFAPNPVVALAGFFLLGAGTAVIFPLHFRRQHSEMTGRRRSMLPRWYSCLSWCFCWHHHCLGRLLSFSASVYLSA